jgi:hypothetical protein
MAGFLYINMPTEDLDNTALKTKLQKFLKGLNQSKPIEQTQPKPDPLKALHDFFQSKNIKPIDESEYADNPEEGLETSSYNPFKDYFKEKNTSKKNKEKGYKSFSEKYLNHISNFTSSLNTSFINDFIEKNKNNVLYNNIIQRCVFILSAIDELKNETNKTPYFVLKKFNDIYFAMSDCKKILKSITGNDWPDEFESFFNTYSEEYGDLNREILDKNNKLLNNDVVTQITNQSRKFISNKVYPVYSPKRDLGSNLRINMQKVLSSFFDKSIAQEKASEIMKAIDDIISSTGLTGPQAENLRNDIYKDFSNELLAPDVNYDSLKNMLKQSQGVASSFLNLKDLNYLSKMKDTVSEVVETPEKLHEIIEKSKIQSSIKKEIKDIMDDIFKNSDLYEELNNSFSDAGENVEKFKMSLEDAEYNIEMFKKESLNKDPIFDICILVIKKFMGKFSGETSNSMGGMGKNNPELTSVEGPSKLSKPEHGNANVKHQTSPKGRESGRESSTKYLDNETPEMIEERLKKAKERKAEMVHLDSFVSAQAEKSNKEKNKIIYLIKDNDMLELKSFLEEIFVRVQSFFNIIKPFIKDKFPEISDDELELGSYKRLDTIKNQAIRSDENVIEFIKITPEDQMKNKNVAISLLENHIKKLQSVFIKRRVYMGNQSKACFLADFFYKIAINYGK